MTRTFGFTIFSSMKNTLRSLAVCMIVTMGFVLAGPAGAADRDLRSGNLSDVIGAVSGETALMSAKDRCAVVCVAGFCTAPASTDLMASVDERDRAACPSLSAERTPTGPPTALEPDPPRIS